MITRILVTGATDHLGSHVAHRAAAAGWSIVGTYCSAPGPAAAERLDARDPDAMRDLIERVRPDAVIHVAVATAAAGVRLVHVSSDAVFSGRHDYDETAQPDPVHRYGAASALAR